MINIIGDGTGTALIGSTTAGSAAAAGPAGVGALNFLAANGSTFANLGTINMQISGVTNDAMTLNTTALGGTSDLNYTYTWSSTTPGYAFNGANNSTLAVNTNLGAPGSTSDRLVVGGNITGNTQLVMNNTNVVGGQGMLAFNTTGITVVAVQGTGSNNIVVSSLSKAEPGISYVGPLLSRLAASPTTLSLSRCCMCPAGQPRPPERTAMPTSSSACQDRSCSTCRSRIPPPRPSGRRRRSTGKTGRTRLAPISAAASSPVAQGPAAVRIYR